MKKTIRRVTKPRVTRYRTVTASGTVHLAWVPSSVQHQTASSHVTPYCLLNVTTFQRGLLYSSSLWKTCPPSTRRIQVLPKRHNISTIHVIITHQIIRHSVKTSHIFMTYTACITCFLSAETIRIPFSIVDTGFAQVVGSISVVHANISVPTCDDNRSLSCMPAG